MKKLLTLLLLATFFMGCSSDDDKEDTPTVKTTFSIKTDKTFYNNGVAGGLVNGIYKKVSNIQLLTTSDKIYDVKLDTITRLYVFASSELPNYKYMFDTIFVLNRNSHNYFILKKETKYKLVKDDSNITYPID